MTLYRNESFQNGVLIERDVIDTAAGTVTVFNGNGQQQSTRPITTAEAAQYAAADLAATASTNQATIQQQALAALAANRNDQTQDGTIQTGAATINGAAGPFTLAQCTTFIKQLATAVSTLAGNDVNAKKELNALIRLVLQQFDGTN